MPTHPTTEKAAVNQWRHLTGRPSGTQSYTRCSTGWPDERQTIQIAVGADVASQMYVTVQPQRQIERGASKGAWTTTGARGDIHTREDYLRFLDSVLLAGRIAGFLHTGDVDERGDL